MAEMTVVLNGKQQVELTNFIEKVGGLDNASGILGITEKTLIEYTSNSETHISKKVLNEKIVPVINDTTEQLYELLIKRNVEQLYLHLIQDNLLKNRILRTELFSRLR